MIIIIIKVIKMIKVIIMRRRRRNTPKQRLSDVKALYLPGDRLKLVFSPDIILFG